MGAGVACVCIHTGKNWAWASSSSLQAGTHRSGRLCVLCCARHACKAGSCRSDVAVMLACWRQISDSAARGPPANLLTRPLLPTCQPGSQTPLPLQRSSRTCSAPMTVPNHTSQNTCKRASSPPFPSQLGSHLVPEAQPHTLPPCGIEGGSSSSKGQMGQRGAVAARTGHERGSMQRCKLAVRMASTGTAAAARGGRCA